MILVFKIEFENIFERVIFTNRIFGLKRPWSSRNSNVIQYQSQEASNIFITSDKSQCSSLDKRGQ